MQRAETRHSRVQTIASITYDHIDRTWHVSSSYDALEDDLVRNTRRRTHVQRSLSRRCTVDLHAQHPHHHHAGEDFAAQPQSKKATTIASLSRPHTRHYSQGVISGTHRGYGMTSGQHYRSMQAQLHPPEAYDLVAEERYGDVDWQNDLALMQRHSTEFDDLALALSLSEGDPSIEVPDNNQESQRSIVQPGKSKQQQQQRRGLLSFEKVWTFQNSRLPPHMPPAKFYMSTWRLLCMAADASLSVYQKARGNEQENYIKANWQNDTKAMILKSTPIDNQNLIVFAIRGSRLNFADWAVNFRPAPTSPAGFLDDDGNACHAGFLTVAKAMVSVVAARLRQLLEQDPSRASSSLLITGHSAGGAIAALLYAHMLSESVESELTILRGCFRRLHCVTFGAPPVSLLPLRKPSTTMRKNSVFMAIVNEGDPIVRAEKAYLLSLTKLLASSPARPTETRKQMLAKKASSMTLNVFKTQNPPAPAPYWQLPLGTLSVAGWVIVLRRKPGSRSSTTIEAVTSSDEQLRGVVFGDPAMHPMTLYKQRVDQLAIAAVTGNPIT